MKATIKIDGKEFDLVSIKPSLAPAMHRVSADNNMLSFTARMDITSVGGYPVADAEEGRAALEDWFRKLAEVNMIQTFDRLVASGKSLDDAYCWVRPHGSTQ